MRSFYLLFLTVVVLISSTSFSFSQIDKHTWFFGNGSGNSRPGIRFDFSTNQPSKFNEVRYPLGLQENNIIVSDPSTGEVIFYSDGQIVVDGSHSPMPNGTNLEGSPSSMYGTAIVFDPSSCDRYFMISVQSEDDSYPRKIFYSTIDLNLIGNGTLEEPLGDVDSNEKNIEITPAGVDCTEGVFAIPKPGNSKDSWLFFGDRNEPVLYIYEISSSGFSQFAQYDLSTIMPSLPNGDLFNIKLDFSLVNGTIGRLIVAPGRDVSQATYPVGSFNFNTKTGELDINSYQLIDDATFWTYGTTFSPDGSKLYLSDYIGKTLKQYDFNSGQLTTLGTSDHIGRSGGLQLGPDGKIYWANVFEFQGSDDPVSYLSVINNPNLQGQASNLVIDSWEIGAVNNPSQVGALPSFGSFKTPPFALVLDDESCSMKNGSAGVDPGGSPVPLNIIWDNGETTPIAVNLDAGLHKVTVTDASGCSKVLEVDIDNSGSIDPSIDGDTLICEIGETSTILTGENGFTSYLWSNGDTSKSIEIDSPGIYALTVTASDECSGETSVEVVREKLEIEILGDSILCSNEKEGIVLSVEGEFDDFLWSNGAIQMPLTIHDYGNYSVTVTSSNGCLGVNTHYIDSSQAPEILNLPNSALIECGETLNLNAEVDSEFPFLVEWTPTQNLSCIDCLSPDLNQTERSKTYMLFVEDEFGCKDSTEIRVDLECDRSIFAPNVFSPNNDGVNDLFLLFSGKNVSEILKISIYDRWGELVYKDQNISPDDFNSGWDGKFNNQNAIEGIYVWVAEVSYLDGSTEFIKGEIMLLR